MHMEIAIGDPDTLVMSLHPAVFGALFQAPEDVGALFHLGLCDADPTLMDFRSVTNPMVLMFIAAFARLSAAERDECIDRLVALGFTHASPEGEVTTVREAVRVVERSDLSPAFLADWEAAKAGFPAPQIPTRPWKRQEAALGGSAD
ncbi:hypothetical protein [Streptomyces sp. NPDC101234]|uniref:hypothetical protein n=1 Tax=Streptomyces sp. NPDC101234 TaxID=3366138 RepID=UPI0038021DD3